MAKLFFSIFALFISMHNVLADELVDLSQLNWLSGHWSGNHQGVEMEEVWLPAKGNLLLGLHRDVKGSKKAFFEYLRIEKKDEEVFYYASPKGYKATGFKLLNIGKQKVVFENLRHDFPQRIAYWLDERGQLHAKISGIVNEKEKFNEWIWIKK